MGNFTKAYNKALKVVKTSRSGDKKSDWEKWRADLENLLTCGPNVGYSGYLDFLRIWIASEASKTGTSSGAKILAAAKTGGTGSGLNDRAATLKMMSHFYNIATAGGQALYAYAPPKDYDKWVFEIVHGKQESNLTALLDKSNEVYTKADRDQMYGALLKARAICQYAYFLLAGGMGLEIDKTDLKKHLERWFGRSDATQRAKLKDGIKKIGSACNSTTVIFSDEPIDRVKGTGGVPGWKDWGFVMTHEKMNVVYLQNAYLKAAKKKLEWKCALTIIHEFSHRLCKTKDKRYDNDGLSVKRGHLLHTEAIINADSWAYFAVDCAGCLPDSERNSVCPQ